MVQEARGRGGVLATVSCKIKNPNSHFQERTALAAIFPARPTDPDHASLSRPTSLLLCYSTISPVCYVVDTTFVLNFGGLVKLYIFLKFRTRGIPKAIFPFFLNRYGGQNGRQTGHSDS